MGIVWDVIGRHRVDLVAWSKPDMVARRTVVQFFPGGRQGDFRPADIASMSIRAQIGTRVTLMSEPGPRWWTSPWRSMRFIERKVVPSTRATGLPGVRIPDLDRLDPFSARRTDRQFESSYPLVEHPDQGTGWTFGAIGTALLKGNVHGIRIESDDHERLPATAPGPEPRRNQPQPVMPPVDDPRPQPAPMVAPAPAPDPVVEAPAHDAHRVVSVEFTSASELAAALDAVVRPGETVVTLLPRPAAGATEQAWVVLRPR
ncbi:MAG: hypothetical protein ACI8PZ_001242 [Myxococcota bacterium]